MKPEKKHTAHIQTFLIHGHSRTRRWDYSHHIIPPMSSSVAYRLDSAARGAKGFKDFASPQADPERPHPIYIYDRLDEPTRSMLEDALAHAEHGEVGVCFGSGMAAVAAACGIFIRTGDEIISHTIIYGSTHSLFTTWYPKMGIKVKFVDLTKPGALKKAITARTRIVYFETPANPTMQLIDIAAVVKIVRESHRRARPRAASGRASLWRAQIVVDNTFATPFCQRPLTMGVDVVVHSLTKGISGFGADMGGAVITRKALWHDVLCYRKDFGGVLSPKAAWPILVYGLSSLALRMTSQQETAFTVARFLEGHPRVEWVRYPGLTSFPDYELARHQMVDEDGRFAPGCMIAFEMKGGRQAGAKFLDRLASKGYSVTLAVSLGQIRTLVESPALMTHANLPRKEQLRQGFDGNLMRLSIGLEHPRDIIRDLTRAFS